MPWGFTTFGSMVTQPLIMLGVVWGFLSALVKYIFLVLDEREFKLGTLLCLFAIVGALCIISDVSYINGLRGALGLDHGIYASFQHLPKKLSGDAGLRTPFYSGQYIFPPINELNRRIDGFRINVLISLLAFLLTLFVISRNFFTGEEINLEAPIVIFGLSGLLITAIYLFI